MSNNGYVTGCDPNGPILDCIKKNPILITIHVLHDRGFHMVSTSR